MRSSQTPSVNAFACRLAALVFSLASLAGAAAAQGPQPRDARPSITDPKSAARDRQGREAALRNSILVSRRETDQRFAKAAAEQVGQDFKRIQILRNNIARHLLSGRPLDFKFIAGETREVNKRAGRLREHLLPQAPEGADEKQKSSPAFAREQLEGALVTLCLRIDSFTENPVFKNLDVVDVGQSAKARGDLLTIIQLSDRIKEGAERMNKISKR